MDSSDWGEPVIRLHYTLNRINEYFEYPIKMTATRPNFGGLRWWFLCPRLKSGWRNCGRRVGKLYLPPCADHFACRLCHDLTYVSCQTSDKRVSWFRRNEEAMLMMLDQNRVDNLNFSQLMLGLKAIR